MPYKFVKLGIGSSVITNNGKALKKLGDERIERPTISINIHTLTIVDNSGKAVAFDVLIGGETYIRISETTLDLSTLGLENGDYNITVIAIPNNEFSKSVESNIVIYTVDDLAGTWIFKSTLSKPSSKITAYFSYTSNGSTFYQMCITTYSNYSYPNVYFGPENNQNYLFYYRSTGKWTDEAYRTINITTKYSTGYSTLLSYLKANATKQ